MMKTRVVSDNVSRHNEIIGTPSTHGTDMKRTESQSAVSLPVYGFIFLFSIGLPIFFISWLLDPSYAIPRITGWGLVCFYLAMGFLSVGLFGLLSFFTHFFLRYHNAAREWQFGIGAILLAVMTLYVSLILFDAGNLNFLTHRFPSF